MPSSGNSGSGGPVFGVPLSQCVEATPWRKRSACTSTSTTGIDIPEITSPTASKASRSDSRISVGSTISVQDRVSTSFCFLLNRISHYGAHKTLLQGDIKFYSGVTSPFEVC